MRYLNPTPFISGMTPEPTSLFEMEPEEYRILKDDSKKQPYR
jgi:hypothetical protein